jgi:ATP-binding cassette subfamily B protein
MCQVDFSYRKGGETVRNVNITAEEGTLTAIVGPSGGGKSTVAGLLAGFWDPDDGRILIGGVDAGTIAPAERLKNISMVFQDCFLYRDTIRENIRSARPDATEEEVVRAAKAACCHDFITALPKGYDTVIGEEGRRFSGGEQRRIALARAFLKDAPILILDEATSSVDAENEYYLQKAVEALAREKTVIMISHRLSNVTAARRIYYMEDGLVWESGTHDELLKQNGRYASLWDIGRKNVQWTIGNGEVAK